MLAYIQKNNDGTSEAEALIHFLEHETHFADCDVFAVSVDDLKYLGDSEVAKNLRQKLGKERVRIIQWRTAKRLRTPLPIWSAKNLVRIC